MKYFLHDSNSFNDEKITELYLKFGYEGLGLFYTFLEKISLQEKPIKTSVLKSQLKVGKKLNKCWEFMESLGIIQSNNGESFNEQLLNFSEKYQIKKEKNREKVSEWREKQRVIKNVTDYVPVSNPSKVKESKVKESKVNKEIENFEKFNLENPPEFPTWREEVRKFLNNKYFIGNFCKNKNLEFIALEKIMIDFVVGLNLKGDFKDMAAMKIHFTNHYNKHIEKKCNISVVGSAGFVDVPPDMDYESENVVTW